MSGRGITLDFSGLKAPCMGCEDRVRHCHTECERYRKFRQEKDRIDETRAKGYTTQCWTVTKKETVHEWVRCRHDWWRK